MGKEMEDQPVEKRWPENTILSFLKAAQLGIPMVELDVIPVRESEDLVLFHNFNVIKKKVASKQECCGSSKHEIDLFAGNFHYIFQVISMKFTFTEVHFT